MTLAFSHFWKFNSGQDSNLYHPKIDHHNKGFNHHNKILCLCPKSDKYNHHNNSNNSPYEESQHNQLKHALSNSNSNLNLTFPFNNRVGDCELPESLLTQITIEIHHHLPSQGKGAEAVEAINSKLKGVVGISEIHIIYN